MIELEHRVERIENKLDIVSEDVQELKRFQVKQETVNAMIMNFFRFLGPILVLLGIGEIILARGFFK